MTVNQTPTRVGTTSGPRPTAATMGNAGSTPENVSVNKPKSVFIEYCYIRVYVCIGGSRWHHRCPPLPHPAMGPSSFIFACFHQNAPESEVEAPLNGISTPFPKENPGSATDMYCKQQNSGETHTTGWGIGTRFIST